MARELISKNATKSVYRDGDMAIKVFCKGFPKAEVLNEALVSARIEEKMCIRDRNQNDLNYANSILLMEKFTDFISQHIDILLIPSSSWPEP